MSVIERHTELETIWDETFDCGLSHCSFCFFFRPPHAHRTKREKNHFRCVNKEAVNRQLISQNNSRDAFNTHLSSDVRTRAKKKYWFVFWGRNIAIREPFKNIACFGERHRFMCGLRSNYEFICEFIFAFKCAFQPNLPQTTRNFMCWCNYRQFTKFLSNFQSNATNETSNLRHIGIVERIYKIITCAKTTDFQRTVSFHRMNKIVMLRIFSSRFVTYYKTGVW